MAGLLRALGQFRRIKGHRAMADLIKVGPRWGSAKPSSWTQGRGRYDDFDWLTRMDFLLQLLGSGRLSNSLADRIREDS